MTLSKINGQKHIDKWNKEIKDLIRIEYDAIKLVTFEKREKKYNEFANKWGRNNVFASLGPGKNERTLNELEFEEK